MAAAVPRRDHKELNALVVLVTRYFWLERNSMIFYKISTMALEVCLEIKVEFELWK